MIAVLKGKVLYTESDSLVIECGGVGFLVYVPGNVLQNAVSGKDISLYTCLLVRENDMTLYGFKRMDEKKLFEQLLGVSGVGPKAAMSVMSFMGADGLRLAIVSSDAKKISGSPGVGLKTAQKIILELKDKTSLEGMLDVGEEVQRSPGSLPAPANDAIMALTALGYSQAEAVSAVSQLDMPDKADSDSYLRQALKKLI